MSARFSASKSGLRNSFHSVTTTSASAPSTAAIGVGAKLSFAFAPKARFASAIATARSAGFEPWVLEAVEERNEAQKAVVFDKIRRHFDGVLRGRTFALWGLAFKPMTDDMREAAARVVMEALWAAGARVQAYDPEAMDEARRVFGDRPDLAYAASPEAALEGADALVVVTEWKAFWSPDFARIKAALREPVVFDGRNIYDPAGVEAAGLAYYGIGRGRSVRHPD